MDGRFVAYFRVSTQKQGRSGLGLDAQRTAVMGYLNGGGWELVAEFTEIESGRRHANRPELAKALQMARATGARLIIAKLDRLARNVHFISGLMESKVPFVACDLPEANELTIHIMAAFAEHEAKRISTRTKEALAQAKARGVRLGSPVGAAPLHAQGLHRVGSVKGAERCRHDAEDHAVMLSPIIDQIRAEHPGISSRGIARLLNEAHVLTPRSKQWTGVQVDRVLKRLSQLESVWCQVMRF